MIYVFAEGGTGSVYFSSKVNVAVRPDTVWGFEPPLKAYLTPTSSQIDNFKSRSGYDLMSTKTVEENLADMLRWRESSGKDTMLCGRCSQSGMFLNDNEIEATCFVRHPLHAMVSFLGSRHPEHARQFGGFNTKDCVEYYAWLWVQMTTDFIKSMNPIYRFEFMPDEIEDELLRERLKGWTPHLRSYNELDKKLEYLLHSLVSENYYQLYENWEV